MVGMSDTAVQIVLRVLMALLCGGLIGLERELTDHPAGMRTHILVAVGACVFTTMSIYGFPGAPGSDRVAAAVVTGIGFIGAGAILVSRGGFVTGLTTAASLWSSAAIGMVLGAGYFVVGLIITGIILVILEVLHWLVELAAPRIRTRTFTLSVSGAYWKDCVQEIMRRLGECRCKVELMRFGLTGGGEEFELVLTSRISVKEDLPELSRRLLELEGLKAVSWE